MIDKDSALRRMNQDMVLRGFAESTRNNYHRYAGRYLEYIDGEVDEESIRCFLACGWVIKVIQKDTFPFRIELFKLLV